ncbi:MAG: BrnT family toxin [Candidatus Dormibacteraceae bacterium]
MDERPAVWDFYNSKHIEQDHPERAITCREVEEVMNDPQRVSTGEEVRDGETYFQILGSTKQARLLTVVWVDHKNGRYPVHARKASRKEARRYFI